MFLEMMKLSKDKTEQREKIFSYSFLLLISLLFLLTGCSATSFRTKGIYEATENGYRIEIVAWGEMDRELQFAYTGEYDVTFSPLINGDTEKFSLRYPDKNNPNFPVTTWYGENGEQVLEGQYPDVILAEVLVAAGYSMFNEGETEETYFAIEGIAAGPTTTIRAADAKYLKVIEIVDNYKGQ